MVRLEYKLPDTSEWIVHGEHPESVAQGYADRLKFNDPRIETRTTPVE